MSSTALGHPFDGETHDYEGQVGNRDHITRVQRGLLPVAAVANMPGARGEQPGEHRTMHGQRWDHFLSDVAANGVQRPIFITVDHDTGPRISEGNHRRDAAVAAGHTHIPAEVRYFGHAERRHG